ncbi:hypothetical protein [Siphonobacter aquaeclarae]|nr:hypothetical protein [Siphonobacter aquaeclarae]
MRIIRLAFGIILVLTGFVYSDWMAGAFGGLLLGQAILNTGCGPSGCNLPPSREE